MLFFLSETAVLWFTSPEETDFPQSQKVALMAQLLSSHGYQKYLQLTIPYLYANLINWRLIMYFEFSKKNHTNRGKASLLLLN